MDSIASYLKVLSDTLEQKQQVLRQVLEITKQQERLIHSDNFEETEFGELLNQKEPLIARINQLDDGFASVYERIRQDVIDQGGIYDAEVIKLQGQIKSCVEIGNDIQVLEERNRDALARKMSSKKQEYKTKAASSTAAKSYYQTMSNTKYMDSFFMDQKK